MADLPTSNVRRIFGAGAGEIRVSAEAVSRAVGAAEEFLKKLGAQGASIARGHGRKTVMEEDVELARRQILGS